MNNRITKTMRAKAGFTLVELIVVIAILGILAGVGTVGYSGYIKKANEAADNMLLSAVNQAFAAACLEESVDAKSVTNATLPISESGTDVDAMTVTPPDGVDGSAIKEDFAKYFEGNRNTPWKCYTQLAFVNGMFHLFGEGMDLVINYGSGTLTLPYESVQALKDSAFLTANGLGIEKLLTKVDSVVGFGSNMVLKENGDLSAFGELLNTTEYRTFLANALGFTSSDDPEFNAKMYELSGGDPAAAQNILVNNAVLYAAKNSTTNKEDIFNILTSANPKTAITEGMGGDTGKGLAQAAAAYGLYTAYVYALPDDYTETDTYGNTVTKQQLIDSTSNPVDILNGLGNQNFQNYLKGASGGWSEQAEKDFDGYMAAMEMINSSADNNPSAVEKLLTNGFTDPDLIRLLQQATQSN